MSGVLDVWCFDVLMESNLSFVWVRVQTSGCGCERDNMFAGNVGFKSGVVRSSCAHLSSLLVDVLQAITLSTSCGPHLFVVQEKKREHGKRSVFFLFQKSPEKSHNLKDRQTRNWNKKTA